MTAVQQNYGEKFLVQFEDFANYNAFELLAKYCTTHLVFNDDIQGTAAVDLVGLVAALNLLGGTLVDHIFLFLGVGQVGTGIVKLIALEMSKQHIFPVFGFGLVISDAIRVHDEMLLVAYVSIERVEALVGQVTKEHLAKGMIYPPFTNIKKISAHIAAKVATKAYELGVATHLPRPENLVKYAESCMYTPTY
ncbi:unnamed protein product [Ilex paraguariensis]|uniref:Malic enzyme NAD-binding domain-containing protein n=1 Tax=Ilex paraguariensis TaxID=185542 RepID=A0ABC8SWH1_9AQUA